MEVPEAGVVLMIHGGGSLAGSSVVIAALCECSALLPTYCVQALTLRGLMDAVVLASWITASRGSSSAREAYSIPSREPSAKIRDTTVSVIINSESTPGPT